MVFLKIVLFATVLMTFGSYSSGRVVPTDIEDEVSIKNEGNSIKNAFDVGLEVETDSSRSETTKIQVSHGYIELNNINKGKYMDSVEQVSDSIPEVMEMEQTSEDCNHGMGRCPIRIPCPNGYIRIHGKCFKIDPDLESNVNFDDEGKHMESVKQVSISTPEIMEIGQMSEDCNHGMGRCPIPIRCPDGYIRIHGKCIKVDPDLEMNVNSDDEGKNVDSVKQVSDSTPEVMEMGQTSEDCNHGMGRCPIPIRCPDGYIRIHGKCFKIDPDLGNNIKIVDEGDKMVGDDCVKSNQQDQEFDQMLSYVDISNSEPTISRKYVPALRSILNDVPCNGNDLIEIKGRCYKILVGDEDIDLIKEGLVEVFAELADLIQCAAEGGKMVGDECVRPNQQDHDDEASDRIVNYVDVSSFEPTISRKYRPELRSILNKVPCNGNDYIRIRGHCYKILIEEQDIEEIEQQVDEVIARIANSVQCAVEGGRMVGDECVKPNQQDHDEKEFDQMLNYVDISNSEPTISRKYLPALRSILNDVPCNVNDFIKIKGRCYKILIDDEDIEEIKEGLAEAFAKIADLIQCAAEGGKMVGDECVRSSQLSYVEEDYKQTFRSIFPDYCQPGYMKLAGKCTKVNSDDEDKETGAQRVENSFNGEAISQESQTLEGLNNGTGLKHVIDVPCQEGYVKVNDQCREIVD